jgi:Flp pilus assembly protein TadG
MQITTLKRTSRQDDVSSPVRGAAAVEMAVVLPVLLILVIGCVDIGRAMATSIAVSNAARDGADWAATHRFTQETLDSWIGQVRNEVITEMEGTHGFQAFDLDVEVSWVDQPGLGVRVTVEAEYQFRPAVRWPGFSESFPLRNAVTVSQYR